MSRPRIPVAGYPSRVQPPPRPSASPPSSFGPPGLPPPDPGRRGLLFALASLVAWPWASGSRATSIAGPLDRAPDDALPAFLDTLLPRDDSPGATDLGLADDIRSQVTDPRFRRLILAGCGWLDGEARRLGARDFSASTAGRRAEIVGIAEVATPGTLPRVFFERLREEGFRRYYSHPAVWEVLGYRGPPQPWGFPDQDRPPEPL